ncbi:MAG TPA: hypothetical protein VGK18_05635 [Propionicimonas sp.]|uniref:hypothetical protein n=1 Tax=Propionicimonas sp. TaxID=1955623 RepID=UPI002F40751F
MSGSERHTEPDRGFGRDGISGLVDVNRALRARDVSRPRPAELDAAEQVVAAALARLERPRR